MNSRQGGDLRQYTYTYTYGDHCRLIFDEQMCVPDVR